MLILFAKQIAEAWLSKLLKQAPIGDMFEKLRNSGILKSKATLR